MVERDVFYEASKNKSHGEHIIYFQSIRFQHMHGFRVICFKNEQFDWQAAIQRKSIETDLFSGRIDASV